MPINVDALAKQVLNGMKGQLGPVTGDQLAVLENAAGRLAKSLGDVEAEHIAGNLNDEQAQDLIAAAADNSKATLQAAMGTIQADPKDIVVAGLKVLVQVALNAEGLGWAAPVVETVISSLCRGPSLFASWALTS